MEFELNERNFKDIDYAKKWFENKLYEKARRDSKSENQEFKANLIWSLTGAMVLLHTSAIVGIFLCFYAKWQTILFTIVLFYMSGLGATAGSHRLWSHRSYKARLPLRLLLAFFQTLSLQNSIYEWCFYHRVHHKKTETNADPHDSNKGFFFAHMGWIIYEKHPDVFKEARKICYKDLLDDPIVYWQHKFYKPLVLIVCYAMPTLVPMYYWNESLLVGFFVPGMLRHVLILHVSFFVNSIAHMWGYRPYDKTINSFENMLVKILAIGEGFHNYHHAFPQDYATSEYGSAYFNFTKLFIDFMALIGQVYDRNKMSDEMVLNRRKRTGNLSRHHHNH